MRHQYKASSQFEAELRMVESVTEKEEVAFLKFVRAARKHSVSLRCGRTVLYLDPEPARTSLLKSIIEHAYNEVESERLKLKVLSSYTDAVDYIKRKYYDIKAIVIDADSHVSDSPFDGVALLEWLSAEFDGSLPTLLLTSHIEMAENIRSRFKRVETLVKPASGDRIIQAILHDDTREI